jgi:hypothetical protein
LLFRSKHFDVPSAHRPSVLLQREVHLHGVGEQHVRLAGGPPIASHDQHVHGIEALEELEDVELPRVEWQAAQANHGEHLLAEAAGAHAEAGAHPADHAGTESHGVHHRGGIHRRCGDQVAWWASAMSIEGSVGADLLELLVQRTKKFGPTREMRRDLARWWDRGGW